MNTIDRHEVVIDTTQTIAEQCKAAIAAAEKAAGYKFLWASALEKFAPEFGGKLVAGSCRSVMWDGICGQQMPNCAGRFLSRAWQFPDGSVL